MDITSSHPKSTPLAPVQQPGGKRQHDGLQQQAGVTRQRARNSANEDRLRQSQADVQSDAI